MRQKLRLRHKAQRCKKHPRSRQGWVLLHPMFPMKLSEYRKGAKLSARFEDEKAHAVGNVWIRRLRCDMPWDTPLQFFVRLNIKASRRYREKKECRAALELLHRKKKG